MKTTNLHQHIKFEQEILMYSKEMPFLKIQNRRLENKNKFRQTIKFFHKNPSRISSAYKNTYIWGI